MGYYSLERVYNQSGQSGVCKNHLVEIGRDGKNPVFPIFGDLSHELNFFTDALNMTESQQEEKLIMRSFFKQLRLLQNMNIVEFNDFQHLLAQALSIVKSRQQIGGVQDFAIPF